MVATDREEKYSEESTVSKGAVISKKNKNKNKKMMMMMQLYLWLTMPKGTTLVNWAS